MFSNFKKESTVPSTVRTIVASSRFYTLELFEDYEDRKRVYVVINKEFNVVEAETEMLPQAFAYLEELDTSLAAAYDSHSPQEDTHINLH